MHRHKTAKVSSIMAAMETPIISLPGLNVNPIAELEVNQNFIKLSQHSTLSSINFCCAKQTAEVLRVEMFFLELVPE